jgi:hypothetical protein
LRQIFLMDTFVKRLKYYGIGFGMGLVFVIFFFQNRGCSWLPDNRVKNAVLERMIVIPDSEVAALEKIGFNQKMALRFLNEGSVDFGESEKSGPNKLYKVELDNKVLFFSLPEESFVSAVFKTAPADHNKRTGKAKSIYFPKDDDLVFVDTTDLLACQLRELGFKDARGILTQMKKKAVINFDQSSFKEVVKPVHSIEIRSPKGKMMTLNAIWYKNKINVNSFTFQDSLSCD